MEVAARRGLGEALHPDQCPKLRLYGVDFAIPPRGLRVVPRFDSDGKASLEMTGVEDWPELESLLERVREQTQGRCITLDLDEDAELFGDLAGLARKLLLKQYKLTDEQITELLALSTDGFADWVSELVRWAYGLPMDRQLSIEDFNEGEPPSTNPLTTEPPRRRWRFWRKR